MFNARIVYYKFYFELFDIFNLGIFEHAWYFLMLKNKHASLSSQGRLLGFSNFVKLHRDQRWRERQVNDRIVFHFSFLQNCTSMNRPQFFIVTGTVMLLASNVIVAKRDSPSPIIIVYSRRNSRCTYISPIIRS